MTETIDWSLMFFIDNISLQEGTGVDVAHLLGVEDTAGVLGQDGVQVVRHLGQLEVWDPGQTPGLLVVQRHDRVEPGQQLLELRNENHLLEIVKFLHKKIELLHCMFLPACRNEGVQQVKCRLQSPTSEGGSVLPEVPGEVRHDFIEIFVVDIVSSQ